MIGTSNQYDVNPAAQLHQWVAAVNAPENAGLTIRQAEQAVRDRAHAEAQDMDTELDDTCSDCLERLSDPATHCVECSDHIDGDGTCVNCGAEVAS